MAPPVHRRSRGSLSGCSNSTFVSNSPSSGSFYSSSCSLVGQVPLKSPASLPLSSAGAAGRSGRGWEVCACTGVVFMLLGFMPFWGLPPELTGSVRWSAGASPCRLPRWKVRVVGGSSWSSSNKLVLRLNRVQILRSFVSYSCCLGGRRRDMEELRISWLVLRVRGGCFLLWFWLVGCLACSSDSSRR